MCYNCGVVNKSFMPPVFLIVEYSPPKKCVLYLPSFPNFVHFPSCSCLYP